MISWSHLIQSIKSSRWCYLLRSECLNLINSLYLEHEVTSRLLTKKDWIFAADSSEMFAPQNHDNQRKISFARPILERGVVSAKNCSSPRHFEQLKVLRKMVFDDISMLQSADVTTCRMLSKRDHNCLFLPLLKAIDGFLVLGMLRESIDYQKLLAFMHPSMAAETTPTRVTTPTPTHSIKKYNFYLLTMKSDYEVRSVLCDILDHLCDLHLEGRLDHIVQFASQYVVELQREQCERATCKDIDQLPPLVIQELNTPTEKQVLCHLYKCIMLYVTDV